LLVAVARQFAAVVHSAGLLNDASRQVHRLDALRRVAGDIGSRLDLEQALTALVDHAMVLFGADRAAVFLRRPEGQIVPEVARGLSSTYLASIRDFPRASLPALAVAARRPMAATGYADDPRGAGVRSAAIQGQVGEYVDETPEQLKVEVGQGITGWVAEHRIAQYLPDAANDARANTISGTDDDLPESMLLAPMVFDDRVIGVLVLSKLGLNQFTDDDLRLLVIYASFAGQAMANADATESLQAKSAMLERQLRSQRALVQITESILTTLDSRAVLDQITDRLGVLVQSDNMAIELLDSKNGLLRPLTARGVHAAEYLEPWEPGEE